MGVKTNMSSSDSPPGPQRTRRSPLRHTPYNSEQRYRRNDRENWNPSGPGQPGDFGSQYPAYSSSFSAGYDRIPGPFSTLQNNGQDPRMPALTTVSIDELSTEYGLDSTQRKAAHRFSKLSGEDRSTMLFLRLLGAERQNAELQTQMVELKTHVESIGAFCMQTWRPSKEQVKLLKSLLRHYLIRPITSYTRLVAIVETYIHDHARQLRLELYKQDPTVKAVVHDLLALENNNIRSSLRKLVFASVEEKKPLRKFTQKTIDSYHLPTIPSTPPQDIMACVALMRKVARPLVGKKNPRGGDTGFWLALEGALDKLFDKLGNDRRNAAWVQWETEVIAEDNDTYSRCGAETNARTQEEIDAVLLAGGNGNATTTANEEEEDGSVEDRGVRVDGLGDIAALSVGPMIR
ncbi:hypothetical protein DFH06DRAFT_251657 [Mycena polygramma]|nr:hypothetical protein DFH06DRAFT_631015 [Mycena polygramma]KAJ7666813.1 hypothetical protein DFH06DRAFT_251657 [Mycena polygramma]